LGRTLKTQLKTGFLLFCALLFLSNDTRGFLFTFEIIALLLGFVPRAVHLHYYLVACLVILVTSFFLFIH